MQKIPFHHKKPVLLMAITLVLTGIVTPAIAHPSEIEQTVPFTRPDSASLISQVPADSNFCRRVIATPPGELPGELVIYSDYSLTSTKLGTVGVTKTLTITTNPATQWQDPSDSSRVWVQVSAPKSGWIIYRPPNNPPFFGTIVNCQDTLPPPSKNLWRKVIFQGRDGLNIRSNPGSKSVDLGTMFFGQCVRVTTNPATTQPDPDDKRRVWVEINKPIRGWIPGSFNGASNLDQCP